MFPRYSTTSAMDDGSDVIEILKSYKRNNKKIVAMLSYSKGFAVLKLVLRGTLMGMTGGSD